MNPYHTTSRGHIYKARAQDIYPQIADGSCSLVISDGPYNMRKAAWDAFPSWEAFREWYRPHVEAWGRACAPAATVYTWGTDESASELRPLMREAGWTLRVRVIWDKVVSPSCMGQSISIFPDVTEVIDVWSIGSPTFFRDPGITNVWRMQAMGPASQLTRERIRALARTSAKSAGRPALRQPVHDCQKPLAFWSRIIRASSRPGDTVLEPFGGTCRAAFACLDLPENEARQYICIEPDEDGRDYLGAVARALRAKQPTLWGATC